METSENKFLDPEGDAITQRDIPPAGPPKVSKGYWDSVVRRLKLLEDDQVLRLVFPPATQVESLKLSIHWAGRFHPADGDDIGHCGAGTAPKVPYLVEVRHLAHGTKDAWNHESRVPYAIAFPSLKSLKLKQN